VTGGQECSSTDSDVIPVIGLDPYFIAIKVRNDATLALLVWFLVLRGLTLRFRSTRSRYDGRDTVRWRLCLERTLEQASQLRAFILAEPLQEFQSLRWAGFTGELDGFLCFAPSAIGQPGCGVDALVQRGSYVRRRDDTAVFPACNALSWHSDGLTTHNEQVQGGDFASVAGLLANLGREGAERTGKSVRIAGLAGLVPGDGPTVNLTLRSRR
jgi:hypothetical protein